MHYKTVALTVPAKEQRLRTGVEVPDGKTYEFAAAAFSTTEDAVLLLRRSGVYDVELASRALDYDGEWIPYNQRLEGPATVEVGARNLSGFTAQVVVSLCWREV